MVPSGGIPTKTNEEIGQNFLDTKPSDITLAGALPMKITLDDIPRQVKTALRTLVEDEEVLTEAITAGIVFDDALDFGDPTSCFHYRLAVENGHRIPKPDELDELPDVTLFYIYGGVSDFEIKEILLDAIRRRVERVTRQKGEQRTHNAEQLCRRLDESEKKPDFSAIMALSPLFAYVSTGFWRAKKEKLESQFKEYPTVWRNKLDKLLKRVARERKREGVRKSVEARKLPEGEKREDPLVVAIKTGQITKIASFELGRIKKRRFKKAEQAWLEAGQSIQLMMLGLKPELIGAHRARLIDLLFDVRPGDCTDVLRHVAVTISRKEFSGLTLKRKIRCLKILSMSLGLELERLPDFAETKSLCLAARLAGLKDLDAIQEWYFIRKLMNVAKIHEEPSEYLELDEFVLEFGSELGKALHFLSNHEKDVSRLCEILDSLPKKYQERAAERFLSGASGSTSYGWLILRRLLQ